MLNIYNEQNKNNPDAPTLPSDAALKEKRPDFMKYDDVTGGFTGKEMKYSFWFVKHKVLLYRLLVVVLIIFNAATILWSGSQWLQYVIFGMREDATLMQSLASPVSYAGINERLAPQPLSVLDTQLLPSGANKYDLLAEISNPNSRYYAIIDYMFTIDGKNLPAQRTVVLPGETRPLVYFGLENTVGTGVGLTIESLQWQRVSAKRVPDTQAWQANRLNFSVGPVQFTSAAAADTAANVIQFTLTNNSPFGYVAPDFYVGLYNTQSLVGVLPLHLDRFKTQETRAIDLRSYVSSIQVDEVRLFPLINVYDEEVYIPPQTP